MTFRFTATEQNNRNFTAKGIFLEARLQTATAEEAREVAAMFPKSVKARGGHVTGINTDYGIVTVQANLVPNGATGEVNETAVKRWAAFKKHAARLGFELAYHAPYLNSIDHDAAVAL